VTSTPPQTFLITGGAGFLGLHLARGLAEHGHKSVLFDVASYEKTDYPEGTVFINGDTRDQAALAQLFATHPIGAIIHGAAALPLEPRKTIYETNLDGTRNVLQAALTAGVKRAVFIGSTAVYGVPDKHPLVESDPMIGVGPYGETKIKGEEICADFRKKGMCVAVVRPKTFVGTHRLGVFQILYDWVESGGRIPVIGNGNNRYQLLEVTDLVQAIYLCATGPEEKANDVFNVGAREFRTVREDVGALCAHAKNGARVMGTPAWLVKPVLVVLEAVKLSPLYKWVYGTADKDSYVSTEKIEKALGWNPKYSNAEALIRAYDWYLNNKRQSDATTGTTHRVAWDQGALKIFKKILR